MAEHLYKVECKDCGWKGRLDACPTAANPFCPDGEQITGCPNCSACCQMEYLCDEAECELPVSSGGPDAAGEYWHTCFKHRKYDSLMVTE